MYRFLFVLATASLIVGCFQSSNQSPATNSSPQQTTSKTSLMESDKPEKLTTKHLPNSVRVHPKVISGGLPKGNAAFQELKSLGVKTIISVDGAKPDVELAAKYGLRYVHLPHGYDGIPHARVKELAKAVRDLEGSIYIHCHHGKHRSPAAASVACVAAGLIHPENAVSVLKLAGTSPNYRGLYQSAETVEPLEQDLLDALKVEYHETVKLPPMAEAMVAIEQTHDNLKNIAASGWKTPVTHPDLHPAHEALLLREHFTEMLRAAYVQQQPEEFRRYLRESQNAAEELETGLHDSKNVKNRSSFSERLHLVADRISNNCKACHQQFRDIPLSEKQEK